MTTAAATKKTAAKATAAKPEDAKPEDVKTDAAAPATSGLGFALKVERANVTEIKRVAPPKREKEHNPTEEAVKHSRETGEVLAFPGLPDEDAVKKVISLLRRAANDADHGMQIQTVKDGETYTVNFKAVDRKRDRKYTADEIRAWLLENGKGDYTGVKIPNELREEFRVAKGFAKAKKTSAK